MLQIIEAEMARHREALARLGQVAARLKRISNPTPQTATIKAGELEMPKSN